MRRCFVAQPFSQLYNELYETVYAPAIHGAKLEPYRVDLDFAARDIQGSVEEQIPLAAVVLAEITTKNPNVFLEIGYAIAVGKPLCIVCARTKEPFPFDINHRPIIVYEANSTPEQRDQLRKNITARLIALTQDENWHDEERVLRLLAETQHDPDYPGMTLSGICNELGSSVFQRDHAIKPALDRLIASQYVEWHEYPAEESDSSCFVNFSLTRKGETALKKPITRES